MKTQFPETEIISIIRGIYPQAKNINGMTEGLVSQTYCFTISDNSYIFQISRDIEGYKKESYVEKTFSNYINVKNILKIDMLPDNSCYCISPFPKIETNKNKEIVQFSRLSNDLSMRVL